MPFTNNKIEYEEPFTPPGTPISVIASFSKDGGVNRFTFATIRPHRQWT